MVQKSAHIFIAPLRIKTPVKFHLLSYQFKYLGFGSLMAGCIMAYMVINRNFKPDFLDVPVFAIYSSYLNKVIFGITQTNFADEMAIILLLFGLIFLAISKQKLEKDHYMKIRVKALIWSVFLNTILMVVASLTFFGTGYLIILIINTFSQLAIYLILFNVLMISDVLKLNHKEPSIF
jgi:hypothetical protein